MRTITLLAFLVGAVGCGGGGGGNGDMAMATSISGVTNDLYAAMPLPDVNVCLYFPLPSKAQCVHSDSKGAYKLDGLPVGMPLLVSYELGGYLSSVLEVNSTTDPIVVNHSLARQNTAVSDAQAAGFTLNTNYSMIAVTVTDGTGMPVSGATGMATMTPDPTDGPYYFDPPTHKLASMGATSSAGQILWANFTATDSEVTVMKGMTACKPTANTWPGSAANSAHAKLVSAFVTSIGFTCQ